MALTFVLFVRRSTGQGTALKTVARVHRHQQAPGQRSRCTIWAGMWFAVPKSCPEQAPNWDCCPPAGQCDLGGTGLNEMDVSFSMK